MDQKQGKQEPTKELIEEAKKVETFNPLWHDGEFLGPNAVRYRDADDERDSEMCIRDSDKDNPDQ